MGVSTVLYGVLFGLMAAAFERDELAKDSNVLLRAAWPAWWVAVPGREEVSTCPNQSACKSPMIQMRMRRDMYLRTRYTFLPTGVYIVGLGASLQCLLIGGNVLRSLSAGHILPEACNILRIHSMRRRSPQSSFNIAHPHLAVAPPPRLAIVYTAFLAALLLLVPTLESLAELAAMAFLLCYAFSNLACFLLDVFRSPSWRPRFGMYHWAVSALGFGICVAMMLVINVASALVSMVVCGDV